MKREEFVAFVQTTIEEVTRLAEKKSGHQLQRRYAFRWLGKSQPIITENIVQCVVDRIFVDEQHIDPCVDMGVGDVLEDGSILLVGSIAGYPPKPFGTNWTGRRGPFVHIVGAPFLNRMAGKPTQRNYDGTFAYSIPDMA